MEKLETAIEDEKIAYFIVLDCPYDGRFQGEESYVFCDSVMGDTEQIFKNSRREREVIDYFENHPLKLDISYSDFSTRGIFKIGNNFFSKGRGFNFFNSDKNMRIEVHFLGKVQEELHRQAVKNNLLDIVEEDISRGEEMLIGDIAYSGFLESLEFFSKTEGYNMNICDFPQYNESIVRKLEEFGFEVKGNKFEHFRLYPGGRISD